MAYIRSLSTRANLLTRQCHPSIGYVLHHDDDSKHDPIPKGPSSQGTSNFLQHRGFVSGFTNSSLLGYVKCIDFSLSPTIGIGASFSRHMSTTTGEGTDKIELVTDVSDVLSDTTVQAVASQAPALNEVAIAAADSFFPVAALQHFIDAVHSFTGLNWWASIALTTLVVRVAVLPLVLKQQKATSQLTQFKQRLGEIHQKLRDGGLDMYEGNEQLLTLFKEYGVTLWFAQLKGVLIYGSVFICFFLAISNMAEKVPSFKGGGVYWFLDLSTPDTLYIFPVLTALTFWIALKYDFQKGGEGNPLAPALKIIAKAIAVLTVPFTMGFPKAIFCYWLTSNIFSIAYSRALKVPRVKKFLGLPEMHVPPPTSSASQPSFSGLTDRRQALSSILEQIKAGQNSSTASPPVESTSKVPDQRISSNLVMSRRIKSLEKQVQGSKKNKKR
ncbi:mitochondrial inner membrane protein OXA1-like [Euphorbia lathyris]|uniref:mitochondrial inner membrane protein OXA1-like n=1 Tax=Euphorbia lathyris TaxID=212925 RepID=UPI003313102A